MVQDHQVRDRSVEIGDAAKVHRLPFSIRILLENVRRNYDGRLYTDEHLRALEQWAEYQGKVDVPFMPTRILMQDFTGVPAVVDIASLRSEATRRGKPAETIQPRIPVDVIIDHSVQVDHYGSTRAYDKNVELEYERNAERYRLLKWAEGAFEGFSVLAPGMGICHQVNLEYLGEVVHDDGVRLYPDSLVGTDSHTPMINGLGILGWGVGGIEAEAAMLRRPLYFTLPEVIGVRLRGSLRPGVTTTDLVLTITELLRREQVVGKFVEFFGEGVKRLGVPDRATIANMSPEYGCTVTYFPIDERTVEYLRATGRDESHIEKVESYARERLLWNSGNDQIDYTRVVDVDLGEIRPSVAGPSRPQDRIELDQLSLKVGELTGVEPRSAGRGPGEDESELTDGKLSDGDLVIAAITSCTNTSNPDVMLAAGLLAKRAVEFGIRPNPHVKTSLAPGSPVVTRYLERAGLLPYLQALGFHVVGYGCTTCIGNSGDLSRPIAEEIARKGLNVAAVLSGNRNFEARIHPEVKLNFLASPPLVVAFALAGRVDIDMTGDPLGRDPNGGPVYLQDVWPSGEEISRLKQEVLDPELFRASYAALFDGDDRWKGLDAPGGEVYEWNTESTYIREVPFFYGLPETPDLPADIRGARALLLLGDSVTTDHISPAGKFGADSPAGRYLRSLGVHPEQFNTYGSRRGNHEVMMRGTFANVRLSNRLASRPGGFTRYMPPAEGSGVDRNAGTGARGEELTIWEAARRYAADGVPLVILAGKEYGSGSSRDWAAKGTALLGVKAVIAESFERIHRSNLVGMGVLPLQFMEGESVQTLELTGEELFSIEGLGGQIKPGAPLTVRAGVAPGKALSERTFEVKARLDSSVEIDYWRHGGVLQYVLRQYL